MSEQINDCPVSICAHPNCNCPRSRQVMIASNMNRSGIATFWLHIFSEFQQWYGDIKKKETDEQFLRRLQEEYDYTEKKSLLPKSPEPIHAWFELSYSQYLTIPRSVLQSMPVEWQQRFVQCLEELDDTIDWRPESGRYWVTLKNGKGHYVHDPLMDYERGRRRIVHNDKPSRP